MVSIATNERQVLTGNLVLEEILSHLPYAIEASFNSYQRQHEPTCLRNTRVHVLEDIFSWADGQDERCIFWLNGLAGTGKYDHTNWPSGQLVWSYLPVPAMPFNQKMHLS